MESKSIHQHTRPDQKNAFAIYWTRSCLKVGYALFVANLVMLRLRAFWDMILLRILAEILGKKLAGGSAVFLIMKEIER